MSGLRINGDTLLFATLADPVSQVRLPTVMGAVFSALGINAVLVPMHVPTGALGTVLPALRTVRNFRGITVSIPHKPALAGLVDRLSRRAHATGSVNLVRRDPEGTLYGDMVDGAGFVRGLELQGRSPKGATIWVVGGGGAGAAIVAALAESGAERIYLTEMNADRAQAVVGRVQQHYPATRIEVVAAPPAGIDFAVNATPLGLKPGDPLPFDLRGLEPEAIVCDIIMKPKETALLRAARERGMRTHYGHHMLDAQIPMYLTFFGIDAPDESKIIALASQVAA
jgi:shikimate dehydrogenase